VRRVTALAITLVLGWLVVVRFGTGPAGGTAFALGLALLAASIVGWLAAFLRLPRVTGYLVFGLLCGPTAADLITSVMARDLRAASGFGVALIAFVAGLQLPIHGKGQLARFSTMAGVTVAVVWAGMTAVFFLVWPLLPIPELHGVSRLAASALAAAVLASFSPSVTVGVITEAHATGPLSTLATGTVVLGQLFVFVLFAVVLALVRPVLGASPADPLPVSVALAWTLLGSAAFGAVVGALFVLYVRAIGRESTLVFLGLCALIAGAGASLQFEPLIAGIAAGLVGQRALGEAPRAALLDVIREGATPVLVLFFTAIGVSIDVEAVATVGFAAISLGAVRVLLLVAGTRLGARAARWQTPDAARLWRTLLPTSTLTVAFAFVVGQEHPDWGPKFALLVGATVAFFEVVGPIVLRASLDDVREIGASTGGLVVVSNREPWAHEFGPDGAIVVRHTPGGVSVALDALMRERGGVWVAHGAGSADRSVVDERSSVDVPPDAPSYRLRRVWLSQQEVDGYYAGFSNSALWPLCHQAHVRPQFRAEDWDTYQAVNRKFADIVAVEAPPDSSVFLNDYHLALVALTLRQRRPRLRTALFWHIPWPDVDRLRICPWRKELLEGLLSNDLVAFQLQRDQRNFLAAAEAELGVSSSGDVAFFGDRQVRVINVPIGADFDRISTILQDPELPARMRTLAQDLGLEGKVIGVGVDRLDYTKGIPERMRAIEQVLERMPDIAPMFAFVQIGVPSREEVPAYAEISAEIDREVQRINTRFGQGPDDGPVKYLKKTFQLPDLVALYRLARFCIVSSLHDGMNLVAKEFVAARDDLDGVLILSEMAGAAAELHESLIINPYDERGFADAVARSLEMPSWERRRRMQALRRRVAGRDVLAWASDILDRLERRKGQDFLAG
jgi:alpha,alpha-trehalose-phosphate synthase [UDP-forming]